MKHRALAFALLLTTPVAVAAQAPAATASPPPEPRNISRIQVGKARQFDNREHGDKGVPQAKIGDWLTLTVDGLESLAAKATEQRPLQLYLNGMPLKGERPYFLRDHGKLSRVRFQLRRSDDSKDTWDALLGGPPIVTATESNVELALGLTGCEAGCDSMTPPRELQLVALRTKWFVGFLALLAVAAWGLVRLARRSGLLRNHGLGTPWSLARTQMAWWFFLVVGSFVFIWMVTGSYSSLSTSTLALVGISAATAAIAAIADDNKEARLENRPLVQQEQANLQTAVAAGGAAVAGPTQERLASLTSQLANSALLHRKPPTSFWHDLLSDENGLSFHRLQMVAWTLVLSLIFVMRVWGTLSMPDFDPQLLGLTGISAGTYLGFKFPEKGV